MKTPYPLHALLFACLLSAASSAQTSPRGLPELKIPDSFGVNIHFTRADEAQLKLLGESGTKFIRMDFGWGGTERRKGEYNFSAYDTLYSQMSSIGVRCMWILDYSNRLYDGGLSPHSEEGRAAFAKWAGAAAKHFAGKGILWEIWNEPNIVQFWKPKPNAEDYSKLALATIEAVRAADPQAFIMAPASSTFPWEFFETMGRQGVIAKLDAFSVHPYRQQIPESAEADYNRLRALIDRYSPQKKIPIVSGEWGYSTGWKNMDDQKQANYIVRQRLFNLYMNVPLSIWYDWHDDGPDPKEPEHHFGTVYLNFKPKPAYIAAKVLAQTLDGYSYVRRVETADKKDFVLMFRKGNSAAMAAWTTGEAHSIQVDMPAGEVTVVSRNGEKSTVKAEGGKLDVGLELSPKYLMVGETANAR